MNNNWMNNWEQAKSDQEDARISSAKNLKAESELSHIDSLINEEIVFILNEIAHGRFEEASKALSKCKERYSAVDPELISKLSKVEDIIKLRENPNTTDDRQLDLPL